MFFYKYMFCLIYLVQQVARYAFIIFQNLQFDAP